MKRFRISSKTNLVLSAALAGVVAGAVSLAAQGATESTQKVKLRENSYYYSAFNKKDPFRSLIVGNFISEQKMDPIDLGRVELVGVVLSDLDRFALLEDNKGFSYILRVGDSIRNGSVVAIGDKSMVARVTNFGQTQKFTLHLARAGGDKK
jgi:hypothetical protein